MSFWLFLIAFISGFIGSFIAVAMIIMGSRQLLKDLEDELKKLRRNLKE